MTEHRLTQEKGNSRFCLFNNKFNVLTLGTLIKSTEAAKRKRKRKRRVEGGGGGGETTSPLRHLPSMSSPDTLCAVQIFIT